MKKLVLLLLGATLTACGGGGSDSTPIITVPPFTPAPTTPVTPPVVVAGPALFSAPQKIDGINITIPYTNVNGKYTVRSSLTQPMSPEKSPSPRVTIPLPNGGNSEFNPDGVIFIPNYHNNKQPKIIKLSNLA